MNHNIEGWRTRCSLVYGSGDADHRARPRGVRMQAAGECAFDSCSDPVTSRYPGLNIPLCQAHVMLVWDAASNDIESRIPDRAPVGRPKMDGHIYYLRFDGRIKVGHSTDLRRRLTEYPPTAELLAVHEGTRQDETNLHRMLRTSRADRREWYRQTSEVLGVINAVLAEHGAPNPAEWISGWSRETRPGPRIRNGGAIQTSGMRSRA